MQSQVFGFSVIQIINLERLGEYSHEQIQHGEQPVSAIQYVGTPNFWFESFQNWQSEFLSIGTMIVLSISLRQKGSSESKPVDSPDDQTGKD